MIRHTVVVMGLLVGFAAQGQAQPADPAAGWRGVKVLPKLTAVVKVGNETIAYSKIGIPWTVQDVDGELLQIGDSRKGWVQRSQVVTLDEADGYYTGLMNSDPLNAWPYYLRAVSRLEKGEIDLAIVDLDKAIQRNPSSEKIHRRGRAWKEKKEYDKAIADYDEAIRLNPNWEDAYYSRGLAWKSKKEFDKAIADFDQAIRIDPNDPIKFKSRGNAWKSKNEYDKAIADYDEAIRLDPNNAVAYNNRGMARHGKKEYDRAIADYDEAIHLDPNNAVAHNNRGMAWRVKQHLNKAIADYDEAIRLDPIYAIAYYNRGMARARTQAFGKAIDDLNEAIRLEPRNVDALGLSARLQATCEEARYRDGRRAVEFATRACELSGWKVANYLGILAAAYAETGDFDSAIKYGQKAIELDPNEVRHRYDLDVFEDHKPLRY